MGNETKYHCNEAVEHAKGALEHAKEAVEHAKQAEKILPADKKEAANKLVKMAEERAVLVEKALDEAIKDRDQCYKTEKQMKRTKDLEKDKIT